ncbi:heparinase II/III family protein [Gammaproteobacteria bacterium]|nr:heparinase II/III family protein [Gammaproteobacteria bacterium]
MSIWLIKFKTAYSLGLINILRVAIYRIGIRTSLHKACHIHHNIPLGPYFNSPTLTSSDLKSTSRWSNSGILFSHINLPLDGKFPDWHKNFLTGQKFTAPLKEWWKIDDFNNSVGDIKVVWELSRMDWVLAFAQRAQIGDSVSLNRLNSWLSDWSFKNPSFYGPNWKCGQEASIRVIHLACAAIILNQVNNPTKSLQELIVVHLKRIESTLSYAIAQDNNHGTSEAAALYIGGSWLSSLGWSEGIKWEKKGRYWLENRAKKLIADDGSFCQYSLNYHRMMLDTFSFIEVWRRKIKSDKFSKSFKIKIEHATNWLYQIISSTSGEGPNLGANDGSRILPLTDSNYSDFRPTIQLAMAIFKEKCAYKQDGVWNNQLRWLGVSLKENMAKRKENLDSVNGGYSIIRANNTMAMLRYPNFLFRPSQADLLHLDFWIDGKNILRDAGSYSYNSTPDLSKYFSGTIAHNTVQFDDRDQMPKISRFLFGHWLKVINFLPITKCDDGYKTRAGYIDNLGASHNREVKLNNSLCEVKDEIKGFKDKAILRWRLSPGDWNIKKDNNRIIIKNNQFQIIIISNVEILRYEIVNGWESNLYLHKKNCQVIEIEINDYGSITSNFTW